MSKGSLFAGINALAKEAAASGEAAPTPEELAALAKESGFRKREAPRKARTGRTDQISVRGKPEIIELYYEICEQHEWTRALTFEKAILALKHAIDNGVDPKSLKVPE